MNWYEIRHLLNNDTPVTHRLTDETEVLTEKTPVDGGEQSENLYDSSSFYTNCGSSNSQMLSNHTVAHIHQSSTWT